MAINAFFRSSPFDDRVNVQLLLLLHEAINSDGPWTSLKVLRQPGRFVFIGRKLVIVVVIGDVFIRSDFLARRETAFLNAVNPVLDANIAWGWFLVSQITFGLVAGWVVSRSTPKRTAQSLPFVMRMGIEATGLTHERDDEDHKA